MIFDNYREVVNAERKPSAIGISGPQPQPERDSDGGERRMRQAPNSALAQIRRKPEELTNPEL